MDHKHIAKSWVRFPVSIGIWLKLTLCISFLAIGLLCLIGVYSFRTASSALRGELRSKLAAVAASTAANIDWESHDRVRLSLDENSEDYRQLKSYLRSILLANESIRYIYTMVPTENPGEWAFIIDAEEDPNLVSHPGDLYDVSEYPELTAGLYGPSADKHIAEDAWGTWLSGYAPIRDGDGIAIGIVGLDMSADAVAVEEKHMKEALIGCILGAALLSGVLGPIVARHFTQPIRILHKCAEDVAKGDLQVVAKVYRKDELGELAEQFNDMVKHLRNDQESLLKMALNDALTDLPNHRHALQLLAAELQRSLRSGHPMAVLMLDIDNFKLFNDTYGHFEGDKILISMSEVLKRSIRLTDVVARYGGDEFLAILPETNARGVEAVAQRIMAATQSLAYQDSQGNTIPITCSMGSAVYPYDSSVQAELVRLADAAMFQAKRRGGNGHQAANLASADMLRAQNSTFGVLEGLVITIDSRDHYTKKHSEVVTEVSLRVASRLSLSDEQRAVMRIAGLLHDVGKIGIPDGILHKPARLSEEEYAIMKQHSTLGAMIIQEVPYLSEVVEAVRHHHERFDGTGYPRGLKGKDIPLISRILAVADAYSAMMSDRPYRKALGKAAIITELKQMAGSQFDPEIVNTFLDVIDAFEASTEPMEESVSVVNVQSSPSVSLAST